jgi:hypothetical protein
MKNFYFFILLYLATVSVSAQVGINTTDPKAQLEIKSSSETTPTNTDGLLIPKVNAFPVTNPTIDQQGMLVYLKNASGTNLPGFYYWNFGTLAWIPVGNNNSSGWNINGNAGTNASTNFIGTTDNVDVVFKRNNVRAGFLGINNTSFGLSALNPLSTGTNNTANGRSALQLNTTGSNNTANGASSLINNTTGVNNTANGVSALFSNTTGTNNTANGIAALYSNTTGSNNTANGNSTLSSNTTGSFNSSLGYLSDVANPNLTNATAVGARAEVGASNSLVLGSINGVNGATASVNVGIGTTTPLEKLHVIGNIRMVDGNQAAGKVLTSDINGTSSWQNASANAWGLLGNSGTNASTNFIGTTDNVDVIFKRFNARAGLLGLSNTSFGVAALFSNTTGIDNSANGVSALFSNTTGGDNTANGRSALFSNSTGSNNAATGAFALQSNTTGSDNTANGRSALFSNTTGERNTANGYSALRDNTTGNFNTTNGSFSLYRNTTGSGNTVDGYAALQRNTTGSDNTAIGLASLQQNLSGNRNTAIGTSSLEFNIAGSDNSSLGYFSNVALSNLNNATAIGTRAMVGASNSLVLGSIAGVNGATADVNVGIGTQIPLDKLHVVGNIRMVDGNQAAGKVLTSDVNGTSTWQDASANAWGLIGNSGTNATTNFIGTADNVDVVFKRNNIRSGLLGFSSTSFGRSALSNISGGFNSAYGSSALQSNISGGFNSAFGSAALQNNTSGLQNTANGSFALQSNTAGDNNTANGHFALFSNTTGDNNTAYGAFSLQNNTTGQNNTAVGYNAQVGIATASNQVRIGNTAITSASIQVSWTVTSDNRWKSNIQPSNLGLDFIKQLNPVFYTRKDVKVTDGKTTILESTTNPTKEYGFIAQELETALNKFDTKNNGIISKDDAGMYGVRYNDLIAPMVKAIQEQQAIIENQKKQIEAQSKTISEILNRIELLESSK